MPKKPFSQAQINAQRVRIMDVASYVMADVGFSHLSMRKLASQLNMTASNIYNYFPNKRVLLDQTRLRGFEQLMLCIENVQSMTQFVEKFLDFSMQKGYYQLMFCPPKVSLDESSDADLINEEQSDAYAIRGHLDSLHNKVGELLDDRNNTTIHQCLSIILGLIDVQQNNVLSSSESIASEQLSSLIILQIGALSKHSVEQA
jgi:AcrR family transcriptional regulator